MATAAPQMPTDPPGARAYMRSALEAACGRLLRRLVEDVAPSEEDGVRESVAEMRGLLRGGGPPPDLQALTARLSEVCGCDGLPPRVLGALAQRLSAPLQKARRGSKHCQWGMRALRGAVLCQEKVDAFFAEEGGLAYSLYRELRAVLGQRHWGRLRLGVSYGAELGATERLPEIRLSASADPETVLSAGTERGADPEVELSGGAVRSADREVGLSAGAERGADPEVELSAGAESGTDPEVELSAGAERGADLEVQLPAGYERRTDPEVKLSVGANHSPDREVKRSACAELTTDPEVQVLVGFERITDPDDQLSVGAERDRNMEVQVSAGSKGSADPEVELCAGAKRSADPEVLLSPDAKRRAGPEVQAYSAGGSYALPEVKTRAAKAAPQVEHVDLAIGDKKAGVGYYIQLKKNPKNEQILVQGKKTLRAILGAGNASAPGNFNTREENRVCYQIIFYATEKLAVVSERPEHMERLLSKHSNWRQTIDCNDAAWKLPKREISVCIIEVKPDY